MMTQTAWQMQQEKTDFSNINYDGVSFETPYQKKIICFSFVL